MTLRTRRILQQILLFAIVLSMLLTHNSTVSLNVRLLMTAVAIGAAVVICSKRLHDSVLLFSPLDFGWLPYILLTALTILLAPSPRRSLEIWLWLIGIQLPIAYGAIYIFRRRWPERGLYRALLGAGGYLYLLTLVFTLQYLSQASAARAAGLTPPGFRLFDVMDHPNIFAMFIAIATPCIVAYMFTKMGRVEKIGGVLWLAGAALGIYATGSRTGTVALICGSAVAVGLALLAHPAHPVQSFRQWVMANRSRAGALFVVAGILAIIALGVVFKLQFGRPLQDDGGGRVSFYQSAIGIFATSPIVGKGPGSFYRNEVVVHSVPPWQPEPHAHDMLLNTVDDSGLVGTIGFLALLIIGAWTCLRVWREQPTRRAWIAGPIGGLIGFCITGILDSPINQFGPFFLATVVLAYIASWLPAPQTVKARRVRAGLIVASVWGVILLLVLVLIPYTSLWSVTEPDRPADTAETALAAAHKLDSVIAYDSTDPLSTLQSGYSWAKVEALGSNNNEALQNAIARFERGTQLDPDLGINSLDLSALYLKANRAADAVPPAQHAAQLASGDPVAWLNLGLALEAKGDQLNAQSAYLHALQTEPRWELTGFWQTSPTRIAALTQYEALDDPVGHYYHLMADGNAARLEGKKDAALQTYQQALEDVPGAIATPYVTGLIDLTNGDLAAAHTQMLQATTMDITLSRDQIAFIDVWFSLGDIAAMRGDKQEMLKDYGVAYFYLTSRGMSGFGSKGDYGYALVGYQRFGLISDYLPEVVMPDITPDQVPDLLLLAKDHAANSQASAATDIYQQILRSNPQNVEAKTALAQLTG